MEGGLSRIFFSPFLDERFVRADFQCTPVAGDGQANITRTKEDAMEIIQGFESRIRDGSTSLADLAVAESDCSSARKRGDLFVSFLHPLPHHSKNQPLLILFPLIAASSAEARCKKNSRKPRSP